MRDTILTESVYIQKENVAVSKAVLRVYSYIGQHPLTLNDAILRNADVLDRHFNKDDAFETSLQHNRGSLYL